MSYRKDTPGLDTSELDPAQRDTGGGGAAAATEADDNYVFPWGCLFISVVFFFGSLLLMMPMLILPYWNTWQARDWQPVTCRIVDVGVDTRSDEDGETRRIEVAFSYEVDGVSYTGDRFDFSIGHWGGNRANLRKVRDQSAGDLTTCWFDPADPAEAVVERRPGVPPFASWMAVPFFLIGAFGLYVVALGAFLTVRDRLRARDPEAQMKQAYRRK